jgi:predicted nucleic acid-binding Zn ribbon protein
MDDITFTLKKNPLSPVYLYIQKKSTTESKVYQIMEELSLTV